MNLNKINLKNKGFFITIEGIHGSGKSAIIKLLEENLRKNGYKVLTVVDQKASWLAKELRKIFIEKDVNIDYISEMFLILAARRQNIVDLIIPYLLKGYIVIGERYNDATVAFQGFGRGIPIEVIDYLTNLIEQGVSPSLTILLDLPAELALSRLKGKKHRFEREDISFHEKVRKGYLFQAKRYPERIIIVDSSKPLDEVFNYIWKMVYEKIKEFEKNGGFLAKS